MTSPRQNLLRDWMRHLPLGWAVLMLSVVLTVASFWGQYFWLFELASHFRLQYLLVQAAGTVYFLLTRQWRTVLALSIFLVMSLSQVGPLLRLSSEPVPASIQRYDTLKLLHMNVWVINPTIERAAAYIQQARPDVISLQEYPAEWQRRVEATGALKSYPYRFGYGEDMLYSRWPFQQSGVRFQKPYTFRGYLRSVIRMPHGQEVTLYALHADTPISHAAIQKQWAQLQTMGGFVNEEKLPTIVVGDLNTTSWGYGFRRLLATTRLLDTQRFSGLKPSWSIYFGLPWVTIDHCLVTPELFPIKRVVGPFTGSDHLPLYIELAVPYAKPSVRSSGPTYRQR